MAYLFVVPLNVAYPDVFCAGAAPPTPVGIDVKLEARLIDINGNPLPGKEIVFSYSLDGSTFVEIGRATTDENGIASVTHRATQKTWYRACFEGDETHEPVCATVEFPQASIGGAMPVTVLLHARLTDANGNPLSRKEVIFEYSYDGVTYTEIARRTTDENGDAYATHTAMTRTIYRARFEGDETYEPSSATAEFAPANDPATQGL